MKLRGLYPDTCYLKRRYRNRLQFLIVPVIAILVASLLITSIPVSMNSKTATAADSVFYDFVTHASTASWASGAGSLLFPGSDSDSKGFACYRDNWQLEDGSTWAKVLETHPQWVSNGWIMGRYPQLTVPSGAELKVTVGFLKGAIGTDGVTFEVQFEEGQSRQIILSLQATYDSKLDSTTKSLSSLAGRTGYFILYVNAGQDSGRDWAAWAEAKIEVAAPAAPPDLIVEDVWQVNNTIRYKIKNVGEGSVVNPLGGTTPFCNALFIDGELVAKDCVNIHAMLPGQWIDNPFDYAWQATQPEHEIKVCADWDKDVAESNEQNNCLEKTFKIGDTVPPIVTITYSPSNVTTVTEVTFTAQARDQSLVTEMLIFINDAQVKECAPPSQEVDEKGRTYWQCVYTGGPYEEGEISYHAGAVDEYGNRGISPEGTLNVAPVALTLPPLRMCSFSISGTIHDFPYLADTLMVKICEAETTLLTLEGRTQQVTQCKQDGKVWYADVVRHMELDLPGPDLDYYIGGLCPGEYIVTPLFNPASDVCQWQGSWQAAKGQVVRIENSSAEGFDFTFTPLDARSPDVTIRVEPEHPAYGEEVTVTILANDDREIVSMWQKTDILGLDGSYHSDYWHSLTIVPGMEGSTAGAQFCFTVTNVMTATVTAKVCDIGGNGRMSRKVITCGSCHDGIQNQGETGIDCGGPCPSQCVECLEDWTIGSAPSAYLYSPEDMVTVRGAAIDALFEYANEIGISVLDLDTGDAYGTADNFIRAVSWWIPRHMGYRGDDLNRKCLDEVLPSPYDPSDYGHSDFPVPAAYTLRYSGARYVTDINKDYFGDCEDFAILESAMLRSLGVCPNCIFNADQPGHEFNIVYYEGKYRVLEPQKSAIGCEDYGPEFIWNDKVGAFASSDFDKVRPWEYTMNYPYGEHPTVNVGGGGFGPKELWLDWDGWGENNVPVAGDFDGDGLDDIASVWFTDRYNPFQATVFGSTGHSFEIPEERPGYGCAASFRPLIYKGPRRDCIVVPYRHNDILGLWGARGTPFECGHEQTSLFGIFDPDAVLRFGDPDGDGYDEVVSFYQGSANVTVGSKVWSSDFSPRGEIPFVGDFDGDGYDDAVSFARASGGVRVIRSVPDENKFTMFCLWHDEFCLGEETPMVGDFNGDGRQDIVSFDLQHGDVYIGLSTVFGFWSDGLVGRRARWQTGFCDEDETPLVGDFNGDGLDDIACFSLDDGRARVWVSLANPSTMTYDFHGGCLCEQAHFYLDGYSPSICP